MDSRSNGHGSRSADDPSATSDGLSAGLAVPDADGLSLDGVLEVEQTRRSIGSSGSTLGLGAAHLAAESAGVGSVLGDFHLFDLLSERGTVTGAVPIKRGHV